MVPCFTQRTLATLALVLSTMLPGAARAQAPAHDVITFKLGLSNIHLIRGARAVLIDAGSRGDLPRLEAELTRAGVAWKDVAAVIVTHGHSDHAGLAAEIRRKSGATVLLGAGDVAMARAGRHDNLQPMNLTAAVLKQFVIDPTFEAFETDVTVTATPIEPMRLERWGIAGRVFQLPGHTPGSLVVELDDGRTFVGDMMLGGYLGGALMPTRAGEHYFHADRQRNLENIRTLLRGSSREFYLGHGGPLSRESVLATFGQPISPDRK